MANNIISSVSAFIVRGTNGQIDQAASVDNFHTHLDDYIRTHRTALKQVAAAVNAVFDQYVGEALTIPEVAHYALSRLGATREKFDELNALVSEYVRNDPGFESRRGRGGGVRRISDIVEPSQQSGGDEGGEEEEIPSPPPAPVIRRSSSSASMPRVSAPPTRNSTPPARTSNRANAR